MKRSFIVVTHQFAALHNWKNIPEEHAQQFLKFPHRHIFHVKVQWEVKHNDRDLEFFDMQQRLKDCIGMLIILQDDGEYKGPSIGETELPYLGSMSCEHICEFLWDNLENEGIPKPYRVEVWEDDENGAILQEDDFRRNFIDHQIKDGNIKLNYGEI